MANRLYLKYKAFLLTPLVTADVRAFLVDSTDYTLDGDLHDFLDDIPAGARVGTPVALTNKSIVEDTTNDVARFTSDPVTLLAVSGDVSEYVVLYIHTGVESTSRILTVYDTATGTPGLPVTPAGVNIIITPHADGWFYI